VPRHDPCPCKSTWRGSTYIQAAQRWHAKSWLVTGTRCTTDAPRFHLLLEGHLSNISNDAYFFCSIFRVNASYRRYTLTLTLLLCVMLREELFTIYLYRNPVSYSFFCPQLYIFMACLRQIRTRPHVPSYNVSNMNTPYCPPIMPRRGPSPWSRWLLPRVTPLVRTRRRLRPGSSKARLASRWR